MTTSIYYLLVCHSTKHLTKNVSFNLHNTIQGRHIRDSQGLNAHREIHTQEVAPELVSFKTPVSQYCACLTGEAWCLPEKIYVQEL